MNPFEEIDLQDCPLCGGVGVMTEEGGWAITVQCCDCGCQTAVATYNKPEERMEAAKSAAYTWNIGKVIYTGAGD